MSDMIDRLNAMSQEVGRNAAESLSTRGHVDIMEQRITMAVRRKRARTAGASLVAVAGIGVGAVVLPPLLESVDPPPLGQPETVVIHSTDGLTVYSTGDMEFISAKGAIVRVAAPEPATFSTFAMPDRTKVCSSIDPYTFDSGWEYLDSNVAKLLGLARVHTVSPIDDARVIPESGMTLSGPRSANPTIGVSFEADSGLAEHLSIRSYAVYVDSEGPVYYLSALDAFPRVEIQGSGDSRMAVVMAKPATTESYCPEIFDRESPVDSTYYTRYLVVDVFVNSGAGHTTLVATHRSWVALSYEDHS